MSFLTCELWFGFLYTKKKKWELVIQETEWISPTPRLDLIIHIPILHQLVDSVYYDKLLISYLYTGSDYFTSHYHLGSKKFETADSEKFLFGDISDVNYLTQAPAPVSNIYYVQMIYRLVKSCVLVEYRLANLYVYVLKSRMVFSHLSVARQLTWNDYW